LPAQPDPDAELIEFGARLEPVIKNAELLAIGEEMKPLIAEWIDLLPQRARLHKRVLRGAGKRPGIHCCNADFQAYAKFDAASERIGYSLVSRQVGELHRLIQSLQEGRAKSRQRRPQAGE
jgi:hypothetical protein